MFLWKLIKWEFPIDNNIRKLRILITLKCAFCDTHHDQEMVDHLFFESRLAMHLYQVIGIDETIKHPTMSTKDTFKNLMSLKELSL